VGDDGGNAGPGQALPHSPRADGALRLDKWLWQARFFKTRARAAQVVSEGRLRVNAQRVTKPARMVVCGDTLTFPQGTRIRVVRVTALPLRRGPATEAALCYANLSPPPPPRDLGSPAAAGPRPTKKDRRNLPDS